MDRTVVIGGGMAGLAAAHDLARAGNPVVLVEARDRLGGRVLTVPGKQGRGPIELGAEFIHGEKVAAWDSIRAAGLATHEVPDRHWHTANGRLTEDPRFYDQLEKVTERMDAEAPDRTIDEFLIQTAGISDFGRWLLREYVEGFHAADPKRMSVRAFVESE